MTSIPARRRFLPSKTCLKCLVPFVAAAALSGCVTFDLGGSGEQSATTATTAAPAAPITYDDPFYKPLNGIDLSKYSRTDDGLLKIATKGDYDFLMTDPGHPYLIYELPAGFDQFRNGWYRHTSLRRPFEFSGYMFRWHSNMSDPAPYIGRLTMAGDDGSKFTASGSFSALIYEKTFFGDTEDSRRIFKEGMVKDYDPSGQVERQFYTVNISGDYYLHDGSFSWDSIYEYTFRPVDIRPASGNRKAVRDYFASGFSQIEFELPTPETVAKNIWNDGRAIYTHEYSLYQLLQERKIDPSNLLLKPFAYKDAGEVRSLTNGSEGPLNSYRRALVRDGQSAFIYSYLTNKTYVQTYGTKGVNPQPVLTLPSIKEMVATARLKANQSCMGKTDGMVVLTGVCDPKAPVFPLTVLTEPVKGEFLLNVFSSADRRSSYYLKKVKASNYRVVAWNAEKPLSDVAMQPAQTMALLSTGKDAVMTAFVTHGEDAKTCAAIADAIAKAEETLKTDPKVDARLKSFEKEMDEKWSTSNPQLLTEIDRGRSPVKSFENDVLFHLRIVSGDISSRIETLKKYQNVSNSVCQPDQKRIADLLAALEEYGKNLAATRHDIDEAYYDDLEDYTKQLQDMNDRVRGMERQQQAAAWNQMVANSQASLNASIASLQHMGTRIQRQNNAIMQRGIAKQKLKEKQEREKTYANINSGSKAYFASHSGPAVEQKTAAADGSAATAAGDGKASNAMKAEGATAKTAETATQAAGKTTEVASNNKAATTTSSVPKKEVKGPGGAAVCVANTRNVNNNRTDIGYVLYYAHDVTPFAAETEARKLYAEQYSGLPSCSKSDETSLGAIVVVVWEGEDDKGGHLKVYGKGFGTSTDAAEKDAAHDLTLNNWFWRAEKGYRIVYAKQY